jgi:hypothetical protein
MKHRTPPKPVEIVTDPAQYAPHCPTCGAAIATQATVEKFGEPAKWVFWGTPGERWKRCEGDIGGYHYVHFRTVFENHFSERLAWTRLQADQIATQEALL